MASRAPEAHRRLVRDTRCDDGCISPCNLVHSGSQRGDAVECSELRLVAELVDVLDVADEDVVDLVFTGAVLGQERRAAFAMQHDAVPFFHVSEVGAEVELFDNGAVGFEKRGGAGHGSSSALAGVAPDASLADGEAGAFNSMKRVGLFFIILKVKDICEQNKVVNTARVETEGIQGQGIDLLALARDGVPGRLEAVDAVEGGRADGGSARLRAEGNRGLEVADGGAGAGRGAARRPGRVVRVAGSGADVDGGKFGGGCLTCECGIW